MDLGLCCLHIPNDTFSHGLTHVISPKLILFMVLYFNLFGIQGQDIIIWAIVNPESTIYAPNFKEVGRAYCFWDVYASVTLFILILWRLLFDVGRPCVYPASIRQSYIHWSIRFLFPDDNLSKHQWIFTKLGMCIDIVEIWFGIANGQILSKFYGAICPRSPYFRFRMITWVNINGFSPNLVCALILWRSGFGLLMGKVCQSLTELSARDMPIFSFSRQ